ncbi:MAG: RDD family protein [Vicingaceae bacterium]|nr:RDD family protein [Vicingaceae bacterium]
MESINISTTQNVSINYAVASLGDRILATLLDYLIFVAYFVIVLFILSLSQSLKNLGFFWSLVMLPVFFYDLYCELLFNGQTFGKYLLKIKVVRIDGTQAGIGSYLLRWMFRLIEGGFFLNGLVAILTILINGKGQRLGDIVAKTSVIILKKKMQLNDGFLNISDENYSIVFKEVELLNEKDISIIREVFNHAKSKNRLDIVNKLADKTKATLNLKTSMKSIEFLDTIIKDYEFYHSNSTKV